MFSFIRRTARGGTHLIVSEFSSVGGEPRGTNIVVVGAMCYGMNSVRSCVCKKYLPTV